MWKANVTTIPRAEKKLLRASCTASELDGDCVYISGAKIGNLYQVRKLDPTVDGAPSAIGVVLQKYNATTCQVILHGSAKIYSGLTPGSWYFVGKDSTPKSTPPVPDPGGIVYHQEIGYALDDIELMIMPGMSTKRWG